MSNDNLREALETLRDTHRFSTVSMRPHEIYSICENALAQQSQVDYAFPCEIESADFESGIVTVHMQAINWRISAGQHWLCKGQPSQVEQAGERELARKDAEDFGIGFLVDGVRVRPERVCFIQSTPPQQQAEPVARNPGEFEIELTVTIPPRSALYTSPPQPVEWVEPSEAQLNSACLSFRHDYGLMQPAEQALLRLQCREWWYAIFKELNHG